MQTVFIEKPDMELRYERAALLIYQHGQRVSSLPLKLLERVVVSPQVAITAGVLGILAEHQVALLVLNHRYPERSALLAATMQSDVHRRMKQYAICQDQAFRLHQAQRLVQLKLVRQYRLLATMQTSRPDLRHPLHNALTALQQRLADIQHPDSNLNLDSLRGLEGAAAASYFAAFSQLFAPALEFIHRNRRPPQDPVNACLSLSYTLLYHETVNALKAVGLDTALGCFHDLYYQRDSLACDLLEPIRPWIDAWVYRLFHEHQLRSEDFEWQENSCLLHPAGKQRFYEAYNHQAPVYRRLLRNYARLAAQEVMQYEPC